MVYQRYHEAKPHYVKMVIWRVLNATLFPLLPLCLRELLLRLFGAKIGRGGVFYRSARVYAPWNLSLGDGAVIGPRVELYNKGKIVIGDKVVISQDSFICTASHDVDSRSIELVVKPVDLGSYSWVAARAIVLPGVSIGEGAVVGAGAVVTKDVEPWMVVGGNPAKVIKKRELRGFSNF